MEPTVGRIVHFRREPLELADVGNSPLAAMVTKVWNPTMVNLTVFNEDGSTTAETSVQFHQSDDLTPRSAFWPSRA